MLCNVMLCYVMLCYVMLCRLGQQQRPGRKQKQTKKEGVRAVVDNRHREPVFFLVCVPVPAFVAVVPVYITLHNIT